MKRAAKAKRLAERLEDELMEVEHLRALLMSTIQPEISTDSGSHKVSAMKLLKLAMDNIEAAITFVEKII